MKMFVWRDVLLDATNGIAVAMAESESEARMVILRDAGNYMRETIAADISKPADEIYESATGIHQWGGA